MKSLKPFFLLDPQVTFLNHGSFGAVPRPVLESYQEWQLRLEAQPVRFLAREVLENFRSARQNLAVFLGTKADNLVYIPNATYGVNVVARSFDFQPGDEVLTSNQEYGACENVWSFLSEKTGLRVIQREIPLPLPSEDEMVEMIWNGVSPRTRLIFLSHITSPTAVRLPVERITRRAREAGIPILVDGAHAPGQMNLDLDGLGADFYTGNCHKWMLAPKGSAFLHVQPHLHDFIQPFVVSWGWGENCPYQSDTRLQAVLEWVGTRDPAAYFSVPAAIQFQQEHNWEEIRQECQKLLGECLAEIEGLTGHPSIYPEGRENFIQVGAAFLPGDCQPEKLQAWMYERYRIEIPVIHWQDRWLIRPSVQGYNTREDLDLLVEVLGEYLGV